MSEFAPMREPYEEIDLLLETDPLALRDLAWRYHQALERVRDIRRRFSERLSALSPLRW